MGGSRGKGRPPKSGNDVESRLEQLEWLVDEQQEQIKQLCDWTREHATLLDDVDNLREQTREYCSFRLKMSRELSAVNISHEALQKEQCRTNRRIKHLREMREHLAQELAQCSFRQAAFEAEHQALYERSIACKPLEALQLRVRSDAHRLLGLLQAAMADRRVVLLVQLFSGSTCGVAGLSVASHAFEGACRATLLPARRAVAKLKEQTRSTPIELDEDRLCDIEDYNPPEEVLEEWALSETVHGVLGSLGVVGVMGEPNLVKFGNVCEVLRQLGLRLDQFVSKFTLVPISVQSSTSDLEDAAYRVFQRFVPRSVEEKDAMRCHDLYRLLEIIGFSLQRFKSVYNGVYELEGDDRRSYVQIGDYRIRRQIGRGFTGVCCYLGEHVEDFTRVAIKWPAKRGEVAVFEEIQRRSTKDCVGLPQLLTSGTFQEEPFFVTELFGSTLFKLFQCLAAFPVHQRWETLRVIGRLVVRRLCSLHTCGYVHCDVSPENVLFGKARGKRGLAAGHGGAEPLGLYLIDFELAQTYPTGKRLEAHMGSAEWSSIQSAEGGQRLPEDDLEALGWMLLHGLYGPLPWFEWLGIAYKDWDSKWTRDHVLKQVQRAKVHLLEEEGWEAFASKGSERLPDDLMRFIRACRPHSTTHGRPDYSALICLLGGRVCLSTQEADREDLFQLASLLAHIRKSPRERAAEEQRRRQERSQARRHLEQAVASRNIKALRSALKDGERVGLPCKDMFQAHSLVNDEELRQDARESLRDAVAAGDVRRICSDLREAEAVGLDDTELDEAREALAEVARKARLHLENVLQRGTVEALSAAIEEGELAGLADEELEHARHTLAMMPLTVEATRVWEEAEQVAA